MKIVSLVEITKYFASDISINKVQICEKEKAISCQFLAYEFIQIYLSYLEGLYLQSCLHYPLT